MSSVTSPQEKKRIALRHDHITLPLSGHKSFRVAWRKKKRVATHKVRRKQKREIQKALADPTLADDVVRSRSLRTVQKWTVVNLQEKLHIQTPEGNYKRFATYRYSNGTFIK